MTMITPRSTLQHGLEQLQFEVLRLGSLVESAIQASVEALKNRDSDLAQRVINDDATINALRYEIEEHCLALIATQQPAAGDLRTIVVATHLAVELERIADHAKGIAELTKRICSTPLLKPLIDVPAMARIAREMIHGSLDAYVARDPQMAQRVAERDREIDALYQQVFRELLTYMLQDPRTIDRATCLLFAARHLERIGDRATNICERVVFLTTGRLAEIQS